MTLIKKIHLVYHKLTENHFRKRLRSRKVDTAAAVKR